MTITLPAEARTIILQQIPEAALHLAAAAHHNPEYFAKVDDAALVELDQWLHDVRDVVAHGGHVATQDFREDCVRCVEGNDVPAPPVTGTCRRCGKHPADPEPSTGLDDVRGWCVTCNDTTDWCGRCEARTEWSWEMCQRCGQVWGEPLNHDPLRYIITMAATDNGTTESAAELVAPSATDAVTLAASWMGRTVGEYRNRHGDGNLRWAATDTAPFIGFTVERYDDADGTDGTWMLNGGLTPQALTALVTEREAA